MTWTSISCWTSDRASQNPSRPASKATQTRRTTRPARRDSSRQRSINLNSCSGSGGSFFSGSRASPGARAATSQLDWLISMTTINVLSGSRTARDLLRSTGLDMERSIVGITTAMVHYSRRPPHSISPRKRGGERRRHRLCGWKPRKCKFAIARETSAVRAPSPRLFAGRGAVRGGVIGRARSLFFLLHAHLAIRPEKRLVRPASLREPSLAAAVALDVAEGAAIGARDAEVELADVLVVAQRAGL